MSMILCVWGGEDREPSERDKMKESDQYGTFFLLACHSIDICNGWYPKNANLPIVTNSNAGYAK